MAFKATLLPLPVAPAINRWGIFSNSATTGLPTISLPRHRVSFDFDFSNALEAMTSLNRTTCRLVFGTSIPIAALPGMGATIRILIARMASARSSVRVTILLIFTPGAGSYSKVVITGPGATSTTFPCTPKSSNFFSSSCDCMRKFSSSAEPILNSGSSRKLIDGNWKPLPVRINLNSSCLGAATALMGLGVGAFIFIFLAFLRVVSRSILANFFDRSRRSFHLRYKVITWSTIAETQSQHLKAKAISEKPVANMNPTIHNRINIISVPVKLVYFIRNDFNGMPTKPPAENWLSSRTYVFWRVASRLPVVTTSKIPPIRVEILAWVG